MERVRGTGVLERFHITLADLQADTCVVASATYASKPTRTIIDRTTALRALKHMALAHPALCIQIEGKCTKKPYFVRLPSFDLNDVLEYSTDTAKSVEEVMTSELLRPVARSTTKPLWRAIVRSDNVVFFSWHHAIADGTCTHSFHAAFLSALNAVTTKSDSEAHNVDDSTMIAVPAKLDIAPTIEQRTDVSVSFKTTCVTLYETLAPASWQRLNKAWTGNKIASRPEMHGIQVRMRKLEPAAARRLLTLCREHKCTITSFFHTLAVYVFSHLLTSEESTVAKSTGMKKKHKTLSTSVPISLRRFTGIPPLEICDHVSLYHTYPSIIRDTAPHYPPTRETFPWNTAAEYGTSLHKFLPKSREVIGTAGFVFNTGLGKRYFMDMLGKKRTGTLVLSNVGVMPPLNTVPSKASELLAGDSSTDVLWEVDNVCFGQNDSVFGAAMYINMAGSPSGAINASYTWGGAGIDLELAEAFVDGMDRGVAAILSE